MWSYSSLLDLKDGLPEFECKRLAAVETDGFEAFGYRLSSITGTYIETGAHMLAGAPMLSDLDAPRVHPARGRVPCATQRAGQGDSTARERRPTARRCSPGDALLIECGWGSRWGERTT